MSHQHPNSNGNGNGSVTGNSNSNGHTASSSALPIPVPTRARAPTTTSSTQVLSPKSPQNLPCRPGEYPADHPNPPTDLPEVTIASQGPRTIGDLEPDQRERTIVLGTRRSNLAHTQTSLIRSALLPLNPTVDFIISSHSTVGDKNQNTPLHLLSPYSSAQPAKSLWTDELEAKLLLGELDLIVHSCKDVPTTLGDDFEIACLPEREDPRDGVAFKEGLSYKRLEDLPEGSVVGTGSVRRVAQLKRAFPGLVFQDMRGNLNTRLNKLDASSSPYAALILAYSGMHRVNLSHRINCLVGSPVLYHAVGQGALAVEIRKGDRRTRDVLRKLGHWQTEWRVGCERACMRVLEGGCSVPVGVETELVECQSSEVENEESPEWTKDVPTLTTSSPTLHFSGLLPLEEDYPSPNDDLPTLTKRSARLTLKTCVTSLDGLRQIVHSPSPVLVRSYAEAERWGELCAKQVREMGGGEILDEINVIRAERERLDFERAVARSKQEQGQGNGLHLDVDGKAESQPTA